MNKDSLIAIPLLRSERFLHVGMALLMMLAIAIGYFLQSRIAQSVEAIGVDREQCVSLCLVEDEVREGVNRSKEHYAKLEREYRSALAGIPKRVVDSEVLSSIRGLSQKSRCSLIDFRPGANLKQSDYQTRSFDLHLEGGFKSLCQFLESLQQVPFAYQIGRFKITEPSVAGGACRFDVELKVLFDHAWTRQES